MEENVEPEISCKICGESKYILKEGFYYCQECGTKCDHVLAVLVERDEDFADTKLRKVQKIKVGAETEKIELTSWECYNYILRGLVDQLLRMGAKEELKVVSFQLWAAYLRKVEVAFFNENQAEIPKLCAKYVRRDAQILYNHCQNKHTVKRKRKRTSTSANEKVREWRKHKRNLDKSEYEVLSESQTGISPNLSSSVGNSILTSSSGAISRAIRIQFSSAARRQLKRIMQRSHIKKHEEDFFGALKCHANKKLKPREYSAEVLGVRHLLIILIVALNLIKDDIQISDFIRFLDEEHLTMSDPNSFLPENVVISCKEILKDIRIYNYQQCTPGQLRFHAVNFCGFLGMKELVMPNIYKLVQRYVTELCLPVEVANQVKRLINLYPPEMHFRNQNFLCYEARAMAYVLFVLKLLFGLDDDKEKAISNSSRKINVLLESLQNKEQERSESLFVWDEWMKYIEMRKVIISQYHTKTCRKYKQTENISQYLGEVTTTLQSTERMGEKYVKSLVDDPLCTYNEICQPIKFSPSFTPCFSYIKEILKLKDAIIPDFMYVDHSLRTLEPFLNAKKLFDKLAVCNIQLKVKKKSCSQQKKFVGIFRPVFHPEKGLLKKAIFDINEDAWLNEILESAYDNLSFKTKYDEYCSLLLRKLKKEQKENDADQWLEIFTFLKENTKLGMKVCDQHLSSEATHVFPSFTENDMNPMDDSILSSPRHSLDRNYLFEGVSDENTDEEESGTSEKNRKECRKIHQIIVSNMDCWILLGQVNSFTKTNKKFLKERLPKSFFWLLETCAELIEVEWVVLYEQLLTIEVMFTFGIEPLEKFQNYIKLKSMNPIKDINILVNYFRAEW